MPAGIPAQPSVTGRYAPSPTGALHLGNLRTALAAWLHARAVGGRFLLRVEDIDTPRVKPGAEARQLEDLRLLGIDWDEKPWRQSERQSVYAEWFEKLKAAGHIYPCFCSRKDLRAALSAPHAEDRTPPYPGTCADLSPADSQQRIEAGEQHSWRVCTAGAPDDFADDFAGSTGIDLKREGGDFVVRRADGLFAYQFVCALDDALSGVTHVLRGDDLLDSGARQAWLLHLLGLPAPRYLHIPLMLGEDGRRLSKRDGADDLRAFPDAGFDATAILRYLAWTLGQCDRGERLSAEELARRFDARRIPREAVVCRRGEMEAFFMQ